MTSRRASAIAAGITLLVCLCRPAFAQTPTPEPVTPLPTVTPPVVVTSPTPEPVIEPEPIETFIEAPEVDETVAVDETDTESVTSSSGPVNEIWWSVGYRRAGLYTTARLQVLVARLQRRGFMDAQRWYSPFPIAGYARFWDSWGEVRHAETGLRPHLGQDVFCRYGDPVLAVAHGSIELDSDANGGLVARLYRAEGGYWYYAHLSGFAESLASGDEVGPGDVIGYCGTSGNAAGTPPHVHFGLYFSHVAQNPIDALVGWLSAAESAARKELRRLRRGHPSAALMSKQPLGTITGAEPPGCSTGGFGASSTAFLGITL